MRCVCVCAYVNGKHAHVETIGDMVAADDDRTNSNIDISWKSTKIRIQMKFAACNQSMHRHFETFAYRFIATKI